LARVIARAGYANRSAGTKQKCCPRRTFGAVLRSSRLALRLTVEINNKINQTALAPDQALERAVTPAFHLRWSLHARRSAPSVRT